MNGQEMMNRLIRGSANINRMREEVELVVGTIMSLASANLSMFGEKIFEGNGSRWIVRCGEDGKFVADCYFKDPAIYPVYSSEKGKKRKDLLFFKKIARLHQALPVLIEGMVDTFPYFKEVLKPFFDASEMKLGGEK